MVVLDTAAIFYWTLDPAKLSKNAEAAVKNRSRLIVSSISIWEIGIKAKKGKLAVPMSMQLFVARLKEADNLEICAVDEQIWLKSLDLAWQHSDPADRVIVATANLFGCPLISPDREINKFYSATIW